MLFQNKSWPNATPSLFTEGPQVHRRQLTCSRSYNSARCRPSITGYISSPLLSVVSWLPQNWGYSSLWRPQASPDPFWKTPCSSPAWKSSSSHQIYNHSEHYDLAMISRGPCCELKKRSPTPHAFPAAPKPTHLPGPSSPLFSRPPQPGWGSSLWHALSLSKALLVFLPLPAWFLFCFPSTYLITLEHFKPGIHLCSSWACGKATISTKRNFSKSGLCVWKRES